MKNCLLSVGINMDVLTQRQLFTIILHTTQRLVYFFYRHMKEELKDLL